MSETVKLKNPGKKLIRKASRELVGDHFVGVMHPNERKQRWLRTNNRYRLECTSQYWKDLNAIPPVVDHTQLISYNAACAPTHVSDGWSLLGRAIDSAMRRDVYTAVHLAYYAELRAAMGLLASEGVCILNGRHPTVQSGGVTEPLPKADMWNSNKAKYEPNWAKTHQVVAPCLRYWSGLQRASELLNEVVRPSGVNLTGWLAGLGAPASGRAVAQRWLRAWGLDLTAVSEDHDIRNLASYRPSEFRLPGALSGAEVVEFVENLWRLFEPSSSKQFPVLEGFLLRRALRAAGIAAPTALAIQGLGLAVAEAENWERFLAQDNDPDLLVQAEIQSPIENPRSHLQMISRATLLLYIATGSVGKLLDDAAYTRNEMAFWWHRIGINRGHWEQDPVPENPVDSWADIEAALDDAREWRNAAVPNTSLRDWRRQHASATCELGGCELIGIWGLTP